jgi:hypothetical protein
MVKRVKLDVKPRLLLPTVVASILLIGGCRPRAEVTEKPPELPPCTENQTAMFTVYHLARPDGSRAAQLYRTYICKQNGKWKLETAYENGIPVPAAPPTPVP